MLQGFYVHLTFAPSFLLLNLFKNAKLNLYNDSFFILSATILNGMKQA